MSTEDSHPNPDLEFVIAGKPLPAGRQGSNLAFFNGIAAHLIPLLAGLAMTEWD
jgi:hypothetical protein